MSRFRITDRILYDICREFNVNEFWLRTGEGEMFIQPETFSLDEYAKKKQPHRIEDCYHEGRYGS